MGQLDNTHIFDFQRVQREKILKSYGIGTEIEKGGEGSKGGKVIGHTKSGKPIYENSIGTSAHFTPEEHGEAMSAHMKAAKEHGVRADNYRKKFNEAGEGLANEGDKPLLERHKIHDGKSRHHSSMAQLHSNAMNQKLDKKVEKSEPSEELKKAYETLGMSDVIEKGEEVTIDKKEFIEEHKNLIEVLETPSKKDDKEEAEDQAKELEDILDPEK